MRNMTLGLMLLALATPMATHAAPGDEPGDQPAQSAEDKQCASWRFIAVLGLRPGVCGHWVRW